MQYIHRVRGMWAKYRVVSMVGLVLAVSLLLAFLWGYSLGQDGIRAPIIIEKAA